MSGLLASLLLAATAGVSPEVSDCPSRGAVASELDRLGASTAIAALGSPEVAIVGKTMRVVLRGRDGSVIGAREVTAPNTCQERASVAAVFMAAWAGVWSTVSQPAGRVNSSPGPGTGAPLRPVQVSSLRVPASPPRGPEHTMPKQPNPGPTVEVAGLIFGTHDGNTAALGGGVLAGYHLGETLAVSALVETVTARQAALGPGLADYRISRLGIGVDVTRRWERVFVEVGLVPELTMFTGSGQRLLTAHSATTWGAALDLRGRLGLAFGRLVPFLFAGGSGMLRAERLTLDGSAQNTTLSRWSVSAGVGLAFLFGRNE